MTIEIDLRTRLLADGTVAGLLGTRIYPARLPQGPTCPAIHYSRISGPRDQLLDGASEFGFGRIEFSSWSKSYSGAQALAGAVRSSLNGFVGKLNGKSAVVRLDNERDLYEDADELYRVIQEYLVRHRE